MTTRTTTIVDEGFEPYEVQRFDFEPASFTMRFEPFTIRFTEPEGFEPEVQRFEPEVRTGARGSNRLPESCPKVAPRHKHRNVHESGPQKSCEFLDRCILHRISVRTTL